MRFSEFLSYASAYFKQWQRYLRIRKILTHNWSQACTLKRNFRYLLFKHKWVICTAATNTAVRPTLCFLTCNSCTLNSTRICWVYEENLSLQRTLYNCRSFLSNHYKGLVTLCCFLREASIVNFTRVEGRKCRARKTQSHWWVFKVINNPNGKVPKPEKLPSTHSTAKHGPFSFTIQIIPILKRYLIFIPKDITWRINRSYNYVALVKLCIGFAYVIKWAKLEKVPERVRSIRKLATSTQAQAQKHISKQNVGENKVGGQECDKIGYYRY